MTLKQFIEKHRITMKLRRVEENKSFCLSPDLVNHYWATLRFERRQASFPFSTGSGWREDPSIEDVLGCLANESADAESYKSYGKYADAIGISDNHAKWERAFNVMKRNAEKLKTLLGPPLYRVLLWRVERD